MERQADTVGCYCPSAIANIITTITILPFLLICSRRVCGRLCLHTCAPCAASREIAEVLQAAGTISPWTGPDDGVASAIIQKPVYVLLGDSSVAQWETVPVLSILWQGRESPRESVASQQALSSMAQWSDGLRQLPWLLCHTHPSLHKTVVLIVQPGLQKSKGVYLMYNSQTCRYRADTYCGVHTSHHLIPILV